MTIDEMIDLLAQAKAKLGGDAAVGIVELDGCRHCAECDCEGETVLHVDGYSMETSSQRLAPTKSVLKLRCDDAEEVES